MNEQALVVRLATPDDVAELARLRWESSVEEGESPDESFSAFRATFSDTLATGLASGEWAVWVLDQGERLAGTAFVRRIVKIPRPDRPFAETGYLTAVYVEAGLRNVGAGGRMLEALITWARAEGVELLVVWPSERSVPFYERLGFRGSPGLMELLLDDG